MCLTKPRFKIKRILLAINDYQRSQNEEIKIFRACKHSSPPTLPLSISKWLIRINRTKDEFARLWMLNAHVHRFRHVYVDNIVPNTAYIEGCRTHWFADQRIQEGSPAYLGLACSRATSYVTHNSTNSITKFEVIQARQPASNVPPPPNVSLDYVSSTTISCTLLTWKLCQCWRGTASLPSMGWQDSGVY